jgi:hypothetical protein
MSKESFIILKQLYPPCEGLSLEHKGLLFDAIFKYQISEEEPAESSPIRPFFLFFKNQFRLDELKYQKTCQRNKSNGLKGGRPKRDEEEKPKKPVGLKKPKKADNGNDNVKDTEKEKGDDEILRIKNLAFSDLNLKKWDGLIHERDGEVITFASMWKKYLSMRKQAHKFTFSVDEDGVSRSELRAMRKLFALASGDFITGTAIMYETLDKKWKGHWEIKNQEYGAHQQAKQTIKPEYSRDAKL